METIVTNRAAGLGVTWWSNAAQLVRNRYFWLVVPATVTLLLAFAWPVLGFLLKAFTDPFNGLHNFNEVFSNFIYGAVLWNTVVISFVTTFLSLLLGYPLAYTIAQASPRVRRLLIFAVLVPFWTSILVRTFAWMVLLQPSGLINDILIGLGLLLEPLDMLFNRTGLLIGMVQIQLPLMVFPLYTVMSKIDKQYVSAAANLGASPVTAFRRVYLPLSMPGVFTGSMLVFVTCLGYFITPALLGGHRDVVVAQLIHEQVTELGSWGIPAVLAIILLLSTLFIFGIVRLFQRREKKL
ncbi:ABC transporter permease [Aliamphritea hakodatensis]|uniref:ABC transporter permease n=1 Tax=Aliamphritea hakodatensis TaxID=2895352 RepID=UPI0022FDA105|nr:ABC transporter permease [Aliamphritea hakodatensis]